MVKHNIEKSITIYIKKYLLIMLMPPPKKHTDHDSDKRYRTHGCSTDDGNTVTSWHGLLWLN